MQVYKFGGASIAAPHNMQHLLPIIQEAKQPLILVVSALGKTTNALEEVVKAACRNEKKQAHLLAEKIEAQHIDYAKTLLDKDFFKQAEKELNVLFTELQWAVSDADPERYDYSYDQIVCIGELMSTCIFSFFLKQEGLDFHWLDIRDVIRTDDTFRDARVDWDFSRAQAKEKINPLLAQGKNILTQGFIGATDDNASVTLGREGSDYTAAMLAAMLDAEAVTIWKDVQGLKNADPKIFSNTVKIEAITYHEVIEMAFYGAQVIHPKTIKPLQNHKIPLFVKSFLDRKQKGTVIMDEVDSMFYPPLIVLKRSQVLLQITTRDFSFITEDNLRNLYGIFHSLKIKVNLIQNAAISFIACVDDHDEKIEALISSLSKDFKVFRNENVELLTVRHYTQEVLAEYTRHRYILLEQKNRTTAQLIMKKQD